MAFFRDFGGSGQFGWERDGRADGVQEERRVARSTRLGEGTLACPGCDAPVALGDAPVSPSDPLGCPFCGHEGSVRDFLSLARPTRPTRVVVRVVHRTRRVSS